MPKKEEPSGGAPDWMCTFADMMSLLLCFFVLLFSLATIEKKKLVQASGSLRAAFGGLPAPYAVENIPNKRTPEEMSRPTQMVRRKSYAKEDLMREEKQKVKSKNLQDVIQVTGTEQGITFRLTGDALFEKGSSDIKVEGVVAISFICDELIQFPSNPVKIEGHTDNTKTNPNDLDSNWLLGANRSYNIMKFLTEMGTKRGRVEEHRVVYESFGEFKPLPDYQNQNADMPIARAMNRRVEITLVQSDQGEGTIFHNPFERNPRTQLIVDPNVQVIPEDEPSQNE